MANQTKDHRHESKRTRARARAHMHMDEHAPYLLSENANCRNLSRGRGRPTCWVELIYVANRRVKTKVQCASTPERRWKYIKPFWIRGFSSGFHVWELGDLSWPFCPKHGSNSLRAHAPRRTTRTAARGRRTSAHLMTRPPALFCWGDGGQHGRYL